MCVKDCRSFLYDLSVCVCMTVRMFLYDFFMCVYVFPMCVCTIWVWVCMLVRMLLYDVRAFFV